MPRGVTTVRDDPASVWMLVNGSAKSNLSTLDPTLLRPSDGNTPPSRTANLTKFFTINQTDVVTWVVDRYPYSEPTTPILDGISSDGWNANTTIHLPSNSTVDIVMSIANDSMDTVCYFIATLEYHQIQISRRSPDQRVMTLTVTLQMGHPMHLHGHKFWVLGSGKGLFPYRSVEDAPSSIINLESPPYRDTTDLPASGWLAIRYVFG